MSLDWRTIPPPLPSLVHIPPPPYIRFLKWFSREENWEKNVKIRLKNSLLATRVKKRKNIKKKKELKRCVCV